MRGRYLRNYYSAYLVHFTAPDGTLVAEVQRYSNKEEIFIVSRFPGIESRHAGNDTELRKALKDIEEEHYKLTTLPRQRRRDQLDRWVDHPIMRFLGIFAAMVAAVASIWALNN